MIAPEEALRLIAERAAPLPPESVPLERAGGRVLAAELRAAGDQPPFSNSAMDGWAVRSRDLAGAGPDSPVSLRVRAVSRAGRGAAVPVGPGEAVRIMTGAPMPAGADAVVMQELCRAEGGVVAVGRGARPGEHVRPEGEDFRAGDLLVSKGTLLRPYEIALLASQGVCAVPVVGLPRAGFLATGDELAPPGEAPGPGRLRDSNGPAAGAALARWGVGMAALGIVPDEPAALEAALARGLENCDLLLVSGGVSVGEFDFTRGTLARLGVAEVFWRVAIKPGKPLYFGVRSRPDGPDRLVFGLPGNPVASLLCIEEFIRPAVEGLCGKRPSHPSYHLRGKARGGYPTPLDRMQFLFCRAEASGEGFELDIIRPQGSAMLGMARRANALAAVPLGAGPVRPGDALAFRWLK